MAMTPWNLPHGEWSKNLTMTMESLDFRPGHRPFNHSYISDLAMTMTPGRRPNCQNIVVIPPPSLVLEYPSNLVKFALIRGYLIVA